MQMSAMKAAFKLPSAVYLLQRYAHSPKELIPGFRKMLPLSEIYSILPYFISTPSLSYCLRLPVGGSVSVMRTTAVRDRERAMLWSKASMC